jgi:hypothetical protein
MPKGQPSPQLLQRYLEAYQKDGKAGIERVLQEQRNKKEYVANLIRETVRKEETENPSTS